MPIPGNVTITDIPGGSEKEGREDTCDFYSLNHGISANVDSSSGTTTGRRMHQPVRALIRLDKAYPLLYHAMATAKVIDEVKFDFYRINPSSRSEEKYATITLNNALVHAVSLVKPDTQLITNERKQDMVEVGFIYGQITWEYLPDSIVATDQWGVPSSGGESEGDE